MGEEAETVPTAPTDRNINKAIELARIIFYVSAPLTLTEVNGIQTLIYSEPPEQTVRNLDIKNTVEALTEALDGLVLDTAGAEFGVVQVMMRAAGSIEIVAIVVATYLAVRQGIEVVDTLQRAAALGRGLVRAVLRAQSVQVTSVHGRVEVNSAVAAGGDASRRAVDRSGSSSRRLASVVPISISGLIAILNLLIAGAVLAVVLTR